MKSATDKIRVAIAGASGYTGGELLRLLAAHPLVSVTAVTSEKSAGAEVGAIFPSLAGVVPLKLTGLSPLELTKQADVVFLALPHTKSFEPVAMCAAAGKYVVDLSADYRLKDPALYRTWYDVAHPHQALLRTAIYGLPELHRDAIREAKLVASPGCYPTAAILQLAPLASKRLLDPASVIIDAKSGVSGAGRSPALPYHFPEAHESLEAYKIGQHRHIPEIEQELAALLAGAPTAPPLRVAFTPHLAPMNRGILSTAYCRLAQPTSQDELRAIYRTFYQDEPFIRLPDSPATVNPRHVRGSNFCDIGVFVDQRTGWVITVAALDNLVKGAAGQAIQAMNLMLGLPETTGLMAPGAYP
jgi:N-acetyl-gamma-glutamyl-phosphate reductase